MSAIAWIIVALAVGCIGLYALVWAMCRAAAEADLHMEEWTKP